MSVSSIPGYLNSVIVAMPRGSENDAVKILPVDDCFHANEIYISNVFSPNGDNINDDFTLDIVSGLEVVSSACDVYDRWGNVMFSSEANPFSWNGKYRNEDVMPGVCLYLIKIIYLDGVEEHEEIMRGDVTVLR
ncbi:MAG: gliding motility-associated C-terminal domain-containing protein [Bacteroidota bacterium]|nr:gliding motility-associated C-terminal domain-containing protein [Bacteroidota bacterium]